MCFAPGDTRNKAALAISFVVAGFPIGVMRLHVFVYSLSSKVLSVSVAPGAIAFTLILYGDNSITKFLASISNPALVIA
ncbi:hypothetical protein D3C83_212720 [compost metagenome]